MYWILANYTLANEDWRCFFYLLKLHQEVVDEGCHFTYSVS